MDKNTNHWRTVLKGGCLRPLGVSFSLLLIAAVSDSGELRLSISSVTPIVQFADLLKVEDYLSP